MGYVQTSLAFLDLMPDDWVWGGEGEDTATSSSSDIPWYYYLIVAILCVLILALISFIVWWCKRIKRFAKVRRYAVE